MVPWVTHTALLLPLIFKATVRAVITMASQTHQTWTSIYRTLPDTNIHTHIHAQSLEKQLHHNTIQGASDSLSMDIYNEYNGEASLIKHTRTHTCTHMRAHTNKCTYLHKCML